MNKGVKAKMKNPTKVITSKNVRFSYANLLTPKSPVEGAEPVYSVSLIISKDDKFTIDRINKAIEAAYEEGANKLKGNAKTVPPLASLRTILRDGDVDKAGDEAYKNSYFVNAKSKTKPGIVDADCNPILNPEEEIYSGMYGRASITFYAYNTGMSKGIACGLNNVQKIMDGDRLGGRASAEYDFREESDPDDDFLD